jgi:surface antigen
MTRLSEEMLNAYADGALDVATRAEVEARLAVDAEARALLEKLRRADELAAEAFAAPMHGPPPRSLVDAIMLAPARGTVGIRALRSWRLRDYALPLAASVALAAGVVAGAFLGRQAAGPPGELALGAVAGDSALHRLLESHPSGSTLAIDMNGRLSKRLEVVATFRDRHARPCREVEVLLPGSGRQAVAAAVACRSDSGRWVVEGVARLAPASPSADPGIEPAGAAEKDALDGLLMLLGAQRALETSQEVSLIERRWKD